MNVRMKVDTGTIALKVAIKDDVELTGVIEGDLTQEGQVPGERDLVDNS